ncbi:ABC transporter substrate-binding protein [Spirochaetia bacterium]|nr:ABC transporter substrate-binding protein [Spirochaetia bacterium]GHU30777.1 ABC transporter substrate-binding protein [Spirochaetia bacterium]
MRFFILLLVPWYLAGIPVDDAWGRVIDLQKPAERIVSLSPSVTEMLFAIGAGKKVVGRTEYCTYPAEAQMVPAVGGFSGATINVERILLLKPDLVILSGDMHERINRILEQVGIRTCAVEPRTIDEVMQTISLIGILTGTEAGASHVIATMQEKFRRASVRVSSRPRVLWILFPDPLMTVGGSSFVNEVLNRAGAENIFGDMLEAWPVVSVEQVAIRGPEWILTGSDQPDLYAWLGQRSGFRSLDPVRKGRVAQIDADIVYRYGPRLADAVEYIAAVLFP